MAGVDFVPGQLGARTAGAVFLDSLTRVCAHVKRGPHANSDKR